MSVCAGCNRTLEVGGRYIEDTVSGFIKKDSEGEADALLAFILGGENGMVRYCEDCTQPGGDYLFETYCGESERGAPDA